MSTCRVLEEDPDLAEAIEPARRREAIEHCVVRTTAIPRGRWNLSPSDEMPGGIGWLVLDGLMLRRVGVDGRFGAELVGEGDLLRPWQGHETHQLLTLTTGYRILQASRVALLDLAAAQCFAAYPELTGRLVARALQRSRTMAINMAIVHQARVNVRLLMLLWHLADRWGRVRAEGVLLPLSLTHSVLADLTAARRPTVTSALSELARNGLVLPVEGGWLLTGEPPGELLALGEVGTAATGA